MIGTGHVQVRIPMSTFMFTLSPGTHRDAQAASESDLRRGAYAAHGVRDRREGEPRVWHPLSRVERTHWNGVSAGLGLAKNSSSLRV